jgi:hypothetical protein
MLVGVLVSTEMVGAPVGVWVMQRAG